MLGAPEPLVASQGLRSLKKLRRSWKPALSPTNVPSLWRLNAETALQATGGADCAVGRLTTEWTSEAFCFAPFLHQLGSRARTLSRLSW
jgi:hypothetical protein